ncbi:MAG: phosphatase PAP2 family protein [Beijerinckiaceae bacterium]|nr:phosphatase PAP2 family protein [Beijerinckiaceae bacterium]
MSQRSITITAFLLLYTGTVFAAWPQIDLAVAGYFFHDGGFFGQSLAARAFRRFFFYLPVVVFAVMALAWAAVRFNWRFAFISRLRKYAPSSRGLIFAAITLALGPGLAVNGILKEHSGRPRPVHVQQFGGTAEFKPWWRIDGSCKRNCSFVSGEVSGGFWLLAPAALLPAPIRPAAMGIALVAGVITAVGRVAFGGHFLSDTIMAALLTLLICQIAYQLLFRPDNPPNPGV